MTATETVAAWRECVATGELDLSDFGRRVLALCDYSPELPDEVVLERLESCDARELLTVIRFSGIGFDVIFDLWESRDE